MVIIKTIKNFRRIFRDHQLKKTSLYEYIRKKENLRRNYSCFQTGISFQIYENDSVLRIMVLINEAKIFNLRLNSSIMLNSEDLIFVDTNFYTYVQKI